MPRIGDTIAARFRLLARAGSGSSGIVFRAEDLRDGGLVALKVTQLARASRKDRTSHEAHALSSIRHSAVVGYVAHGETQDGHRYLAMQWIEGRDVVGGSSVLVPFDLVHMDMSSRRRPAEGVFRFSSNGLAAGNDLLEAR